jgi:hypothetical protein
MPRVPAPADPGRGVSRSGARPEPDSWQPVITRPDPVPLEEWLAWDPDEEDEPPGFCEDDLDPEGSGLPWDEDLAAIVAETDQIMAGRAADAVFLARAETAELAGAMLADEARKRGPRGPGLPGSAERLPGVSSGPAGGFGARECLDVVAGSAALPGFVERAVDSGRLGEASDGEVVGLICAADRAEASACWLKHAAVAELLRRRPAPGAAVVEGTGGMPEAYLESASAEVKWALAETRQAADGVASLAWDLAVRRAVKRVAPRKAKDRREHGAGNARVERWQEDSGNAGLSIREAPPARVLAADGRITWWARQLRAAGVAGGMDVLRARAARRVRDLAVHHRDPRPAGLAVHHRPDPGRGLRPPLPGLRARPRRQAPAPDPGPPRDMHRADVRAALPGTSSSTRTGASPGPPRADALTPPGPPNTRSDAMLLRGMR